MPRLEEKQTAVQKAGATVSDLLRKQQKAFEAGLPAFMRDQADRFVRTALTTIRRNPGLLKCDPRSLLASLQESAQLGLMPDGVMGHCYLIPFKSEAQLVIGYKGLLALAWRSGQIKSVTVECVFERDEFRRMGRHTVLEHVAFEDGDPGPLKYAYAVVETSGGGKVSWCVDRAQIERIKQSSAGASRRDSPWNTHPETMWMKSALRRALKFAPCSTDLQRAIAIDEHAEAGVRQDLREADFSVLPDEATPEPEGSDYEVNQQNLEAVGRIQKERGLSAKDLAAVIKALVGKACGLEDLDGTQLADLVSLLGRGDEEIKSIIETGDISF